MASTNKTAHYELSQYVGSDKPTYLTDYNNDMENIDTGIYNAQTTANSAQASASIADGKADNATLTANSALTNAGTANTNIGTMANLETTEKGSLVGAVNEVKEEADYTLNMWNMTSSTVTATISNGHIAANELYVAKNSDCSLFKFYGRFVVDQITNNRGLTITINAGLTGVTSEYTVNGMIRFIVDAQGGRTVQAGSFTVKTNGNIEITVATDPGFPRYDFFFQPCIYVNKDFGDSAN